MVEAGMVEKIKRKHGTLGRKGGKMRKLV